MTRDAGSSSSTVEVRYDVVRNLTSPQEKENSAKSFFANVPVREVLKFDTARNLRGYIAEHPGKKRSLVHRAIYSSIEDNPDRFIQWSSGITVAAEGLEVDDNKKVLRVKNGSIINGAQTQGEIALFFKRVDQEALAEPDFQVRVEFVVDPDPANIVETAIARNTSTNIQRLTMAGARQFFGDLDESFRKTFPNQQLAKSETDVGENFVDTQRVLQTLWAMMPEELLPMKKKGQTVADARLKAYKNKAYCLEDFRSDFEHKDTDENAAERYRYFCDMAGKAWKEYMHWRHHQRWHGKRLKEHTKSVTRSKEQVTVADGIVFPILSAMAQFVVKDPDTGRWDLKKPEMLDDGDIIQAARDQLSGHKGNPMAMGRDASSYNALTSLTKAIKRFSSRVDAA